MSSRLKVLAARLLPCCGPASLWKCSMSSAKTPFLDGDEEVEAKSLPGTKPSQPVKVVRQAPVVETEDAIEQGDDGLSVLPPELLHLIFQFLTPRDLASARLVCRDWHTMSTATVSSLAPSFCMASRLGAAFPNLTHLDLSRASGVMDRDVERLEGLSNLTILSLAKCRRVTDVAVLTLAISNPDLEVLNLARCHSLTGTSFEALEVGQLSKLRRLNLKHCRLTAESVSALSRLESLEDLNVSKCWSVSDVGLQHLATLQHLTVLRMNGCDGVTDAGLAYVARMHGLQMLKWRMSREVPAALEHITSEGIIQLSVGLPDLVHLQLSLGREVSPEALVSLTKLRALQDLRLYCACDVSDDSLEAFGGLPHLGRFTIHASERSLSTSSVEHLTRLKHLKMLDVDALADATSDLGHLAVLSKLSQLRITRCLFWGPSIASLAAHLTWLDLSHCPLASTGLLEAVGKLPRLRALNLTDCKGLKDVLLLCLSGLARLQQLSLSSCPGLKGHKLCVLGPHLQSLEALDLSFCNSLDSAVLPFAMSQFPALTHLNLSLCRSLRDTDAFELCNNPNLQVLNISNSGLARGSMSAILDTNTSLSDESVLAAPRCRVIQKRPEPDAFKPPRLA